jgi:hypothetical protein
MILMGGLLVIDISKPRLPNLAGSTDTFEFTCSVAISDNFSYVADGLSDLSILPAAIPSITLFKIQRLS